MKHLKKYEAVIGVDRDWDIQDRSSQNDKIIREIENYTSEYIKDIHQIGSDNVNVVEFELIDCLDVTRHLSIKYLTSNDSFGFYIEKTLLQIVGSMEDWRQPMLIIENTIKKKYEQDILLQTCDKMFSVITEDSIKDYFAELFDYNEYKISKFNQIGIPIFWIINVKLNKKIIPMGSAKLTEIDNDFIETMDILIPSVSRLKEVFDITVLYRFSIKGLIIYIMANDENGKPIGQNFI
jgi:hypothetical protein